MPDKTPALEIWGGIECTVNRVADTYYDQCERSGHHTRLSDLDLFAQLGITALRYPVLWERVAPDGLNRADWSWTDERLGRLRELGIQPIIGLVHHGSGPRHTSLIDQTFATGLAEFAGAVAMRYPWITHYTPINEPLTTARFSGLYGYWYPHGTDDLTFARALLTQCRAVVLAMRTIRQHNPAARLVQTDDLGYTFSTAALAYQAEFENIRRWATFDLLCGNVGPDHRLWQYLRFVGIPETELMWFRDNQCPPDIVGINYYLTSERFLDEQVEHYPSHLHGGNVSHAYADVEAVRVRASGLMGPRTLLKQVWERYHRPIAITEVHNGCTREEQLRWLVEVWDAACDVRAEGVDLRAITAWALLGGYDWDSLVTRADNHYEPGIFDLRASPPRPTVLAHAIRELAAGRRPSHPVLATPGWWHRPERLIYDIVLATDELPASPMLPVVSAQPVLIAGNGDELTATIATDCQRRGLAFELASMSALSSVEVLARIVDERVPWAVVYTRALADDLTPLTTVCARRGIVLLCFSSARVFDGAKRQPYHEDDPVVPARARDPLAAAAEEHVLATLSTSLIVRTGVQCGTIADGSFSARALATLLEGGPHERPSDLISVSVIPDLVQACLDLLIDGEHGIWHLAHPGALTRAELLHQITKLSVNEAYVPALTGMDRVYCWAIESIRGTLLTPVEQVLERYVREHIQPRFDQARSVGL